MSSHDRGFVTHRLDSICYSSVFVIICHPAWFAASPFAWTFNDHRLPTSSTTRRILPMFSFHRFLIYFLSHLVLATYFDWTYVQVRTGEASEIPPACDTWHISTRYTPMYNYPTLVYTLLQYLFYGITSRVEYLCTHSKNHLRASGSTPGVMPCPRFAIHPFAGLPPTRNVAHI